jgi:predicted metal-dependent HD superfamily phosphohydrolase
VLLDADLAILAATEAEYSRYAQAIRHEYAWLPENEYRAGRRGLLERFLALDRIYRTEKMFQAGEEQARRNMRKEIEGLS